MNAHDIYMGYPCQWLSGKPRQKFEFALYAHEGDWDSVRVPEIAWEYNCPPLLVPGVKATATKSFVQTSDNVLVEALRREGEFLEMRLVECRGHAGQAKSDARFARRRSFSTDLTGADAKPFPAARPMNSRFAPSKSSTLRFKTAKPVEEVKPLLKWDELVPPAKLPQLLKRPVTLGRETATGPQLRHDEHRSRVRRAAAARRQSTWCGRSCARPGSRRYAPADPTPSRRAPRRVRQVAG